MCRHGVLTMWRTLAHVRARVCARVHVCSCVCAMCMRRPRAFERYNITADEINAVYNDPVVMTLDDLPNWRASEWDSK